MSFLAVGMIFSGKLVFINVKKGQPGIAMHALIKMTQKSWSNRKNRKRLLHSSQIYSKLGQFSMKTRSLILLNYGQKSLFPLTSNKQSYAVYVQPQRQANRKNFGDINTVSDPAFSAKSYTLFVKIYFLPSRDIPSCRHFVSLHDWHLFLLTLSTIQFFWRGQW